MPFLTGGPYRNDIYTFPASNRRAFFLDSLRTTLLACGWTSSVLRPKSTFTWTAQPANASTLTLNGKVYTFQTVLTNVDGNVFIGATLAATIQNFVNAVILGPGAGTAYAAATTAPPAVTVLLSDTTSVTICGTNTTDPYTNTGIAVSNGGTINGSWGATTLNRGGWIFRSPEAPTDFSQACIIAWAVNYTDASGTDVNMFITSRDASEVANFANVFSGTATGGFANPTSLFTGTFLTGGVQFRVVASPRMVVITRPGSTSNDGENFFFNMGAIPSFMRGKKISGASNTTPITITTTAAHGYTTGQTVRCLYVNGNTAANTTAVITVVSPTQFQLNATVGNGAYTNGGVCINLTLKETCEAISALGCANTGGVVTFRNSVSLESTAIAGNRYILNGTFYVYGGGGVGYRAAYTFPLGNTATSVNQWQNDNALLLDPWVAFPSGGPIGAAPRITALWADMAWATQASPVDTIPAPFLGRTWMSLQNNVSAVSWLVVTG